MKMNLNHKLYTITAVFIIIPIIFYVCMFYSQPISTDSSNWSDFATYLTGFVSTANLLVFILLTREIHAYNLNKDEQNSKQDKPIISFKLQPGSKKYFAENVGKGTALNVIICGNLGDNKWLEAYHYYSFSPNAEKEVKVNMNNALLAKYTDIFGTEYISFMDGDKLRYFEIEVEKVKKEYPEEYRKSKFETVQPTWIV
jgi:hypothetical protein